MGKSRTRETSGDDEKRLNSGFTLKMELIGEKDRSQVLNQNFQNKNWKNELPFTEVWKTQGEKVVEEACQELRNTCLEKLFLDKNKSYSYFHYGENLNQNIVPYFVR